MKKLFTVFLALLFTLTPVCPVSASRYVLLPGITEAVVVEVIDGDSIVVRSDSSGQYALVRFAGINSNGYTPAYEYLCAVITGKHVTVRTDSNALNDGRWNYAYVDYQGSMINSLMLILGYAKTDISQSKLSYFNYFLTLEKDAKRQGLGIWGEALVPGTSSAVMTNINTAGADMLAERFGIAKSVASNIVTYRSTNPFNDINEIRFVPLFGREDFEKNSSSMTVCTDVNTASEAELLSLANFTSDDADSVMTYRSSKGTIASLSSLNTSRTISGLAYTSNLSFMSVKPTETIALTKNAYRININTAGYDQLLKTGISQDMAKSIVEARGLHSYKTKTEIMYELQLPQKYFNTFEDNFSVITNINTADRDELLSLFGGDRDGKAPVDLIMNNRPITNKYALAGYISTTAVSKIDEFISYAEPSSTSLEKDVQKRVNIKTATRTQLEAAGIPVSLAQSIITGSRIYRTPAELPASLVPYRDRITLFTDINSASYDELLSLSPSITSAMATAIMMQRNIRPYAYLDEIAELCVGFGKEAVYGEIKDVIVFR